RKRAVIESNGSGLTEVERRLRRFKRPLYAAILCLVGIQSLIADRILGSELEAFARYAVAAAAFAASLLILTVPRWFRGIEIGVPVAGIAISIGFLSVALESGLLTHAAAIRTFTIWLVLLIVWAFMAFRSRFAVGISAL